jgi:hypothetical protein
MTAIDKLCHYISIAQDTISEAGIALDPQQGENIAALMLELAAERPSSMKRYQKWTEAEDNVIREMRTAGTAAVYDGIASLLGRSSQAVRNRALVLGLTGKEKAT